MLECLGNIVSIEGVEVDPSKILALVSLVVGRIELD